MFITLMLKLNQGNIRGAKMDLDNNLNEEKPAGVTPAVEAPTAKKTGNLFKILCVVLVLVVIGLVVYICLDKTSSNDTASRVDSGETEKCVTATEDEKETKEIATGGNGYVYGRSDVVLHGAYFVTKNGDVYYVPATTFYGGQQYNITLSDAGNIGEKGTYTLKFSDFESWYEMGNDSEEFTLDGYKLDLSNIVTVIEAEYGQQKTTASTIFVDKEGNLSTLTSSNLYEGSFSLKLNKNVDSNVRGVTNAIGGDEVLTIVHYMDGSSKEADYKKYGFTN